MVSIVNGGARGRNHPALAGKRPVHRVTGGLEEQRQMLPRLGKNNGRFWGIKWELGNNFMGFLGFNGNSCDSGGIEWDKNPDVCFF